MWKRPHIARKRRKGAKDRGIALIMVLTAIAIFTAVVVDFTYSSRVELDLAANSRDEVRAYFLAKSAVNLSRLVLHFQKQMDQTMGQQGLGAPGGAGKALAGIGNLGGVGASLGNLGNLTSMIPGMGGGLNIQLYKLIPIDSGMVQMFLGGAGVTAGLGEGFDEKGELKPLKTDEKSDAPAFGQDDPNLAKGKGQVKSFGDFSGSYHAEIDDEEAKLNVARLNIPSGRIQQVAITQALMMFGDKRYEWLYDDEDAHGDRVKPTDLVINIHDYIDANTTQAQLNPQDPVNPLTDGFSDEQQAYSRYTPAYHPKNAPFDSVDELYMVGGMNDRILAAFKDRLTVYPDINRALNVNTDDPFMQLLNIYLAAANPNDPALQNPLTIQQILHDLQMVKMFPGMGLTVTQFVAILAANKIAVDPALTQQGGNGNIKLADHTETFTIHATGEVGKVQKKLTAVVRTDAGLGQLLYWREE